MFYSGHTVEGIPDLTYNLSMDYYWKKKTILSFVLSVMVTWIHTSAFEQYTLQLPYHAGMSEAVTVCGYFFQYTVCRVAVPLFFIMAGANFFRNYSRELYGKKLLSRARSLLVPYLVWNTLVMLFYIVTSYTAISRFFTGRERFVLSLSNVVEAVLFRKCNYVFWFMYDLIIYTILTPLFDLLTSRKWIGWLFTIGALFLPLLRLRAFDVIRIDESYLVFYAFGCMIGKHYFHIFTERANGSVRAVSAVACIACMTLQMLHKCGVLILPAVVMNALVLLFALAFWNVADAVVPAIRERTFMKSTMFIYALHPDVSAVIVKCIYLIGPEQMWMAFVNFGISAVLTVAVICVAAELLRRYLPKAYGVLAGFRQ